MPPTSQSNLIKPRIKETKIKKLTIQLKAAYIILIIVIISAAFIILDYYLKQYALAVTGNYSKTVTDELTANDWNNLLPDFVDASGDTMNGDLNVIGSITATNQICDSTGCISLISGGAGWSGAGSGQMHPTALTDKIGINTDTPAHELVVRDANGQSGIYIWGDSSNAEIALGDGANHWAIYSDETNTDDLRFWRGSDRMVITDTGNVGIGTAGPEEMLDVYGGIDTNTYLQTRYGKTDIGNIRAFVGVEDSASGNNLAVFGADSGVTDISFQIGGKGVANEKVRITNIGNVGIGTTEPAGRVHINSTSGHIILEDTDEGGSLRMERDGGGFNIELVSTNAKLFRVNDNGNVGIGTTNPEAKLDVAGDITATPTIFEVYPSDHNTAGATGYIKVTHNTVNLNTNPGSFTLNADNTVTVHKSGYYEIEIRFLVNKSQAGWTHTRLVVNGGHAGWLSHSKCGYNSTSWCEEWGVRKMYLSAGSVLEHQVHLSVAQTYTWHSGNANTDYTYMRITKLN